MSQGWPPQGGHPPGNQPPGQGHPHPGYPQQGQPVQHPGQHPYAPPGPGNPGPANQPAAAALAASIPSGKEAGSFISGLLDFSFTNLITLRVIKVLYLLFLALVGLGALGGVLSILWALFSGEVIQALATLVVLPIGLLFYVIIGRVYFELVVVMFNIHEHAAAIKENTAK